MVVGIPNVGKSSFINRLAGQKKAKVEAVVPANTETMSLEDFQTAVLKLKSMLDNGLISTEEFAEEKKKLMPFLY